MKTNKAGIIGQLEFRSPKVKALYAFIWLVLFIITLICLFPPLWLILSSLKDTKEFYAIPPTFIPHSLHFEKLTVAWQAYHFLQGYWNTFIMMLGNLFFAIVVNALAGYVFSKLRPRGSKFLYQLIIYTMLFPHTLSIVPVFQNIVSFPIGHFSMMNTYWPMWFFAAAVPFNVMVFKTFFDRIPNEMIEAARIDGCGQTSLLFRIMLPLSVPVIMTIAILTVNASWADFFWPYMVLKKPELQTVIVSLYTVSGQVPLDIQFIGLVFSILPPIAMFIVFQKYIMQGFVFSGIKG